MRIKNAVLMLIAVIGAAVAPFVVVPSASADYAADMIATHRFYNLKTGTHFYTANDNESNHVRANLASTYRYENIGFHAYSTPAPDRVPVHRFYNFQNGVHFYTANQNEATQVNNSLTHIYRYEGISYYSDAAVIVSNVGVHRFYNFRNGTHFYTGNQNEATYVNSILYHTYRYEGVAYGAAEAKYFKSCSEANAAGYYAMKRGQPGYGIHLDRDNDGIACDIVGASTNTPMTVAQATVINIVDGDTIDVRINSTLQRVRLIGVDTPETVDQSRSVQCYGPEASNYTKSTLSNKTVTLDPDTSQGNTDAYGRLLRYVVLPDSTNFNEALIRHGYAKEYTFRTPYKHQSTFMNAQLEARNLLRGLWSPGTCNGNTTQST